MTPAGIGKKKHDFDPNEFLTTIAEGRTIVSFPKKQIIFAQGDACESVFYIQNGKVRLTVVSKTGKEATIGILSRVIFSEKVVLRANPCA